MLNRLKPIISLGLLALGFSVTLLTGATPWSQAASLAGLRSMKQMAQEAVPYERAIANSKPTLIEFYADWCSICQAMAPTLHTLEQQYGTDVNFVMLNVDDPQWLPQIERYRVTGVPHFIALGSKRPSTGDPTVVRSLVGQLPLPILSQVLDQLMIDPAQPS